MVNEILTTTRRTSEIATQDSRYRASQRAWERGGKGDVTFEREVRRDWEGIYWDLGGNTCKDPIVFFFRFLRPPDERKNPDWPELVRST